MKKIMITVGLMLGIGFTQMNAQETNKISFGVKAEGNVSNFLFEDMPGWTSTLNAGASLGGSLKINYGKHFALQPELLFHVQNSKLEFGNIENDFQYWGMEVPLYAIGQLTTENGDRAYIGVGPYGRLGFSAKNTTTDTQYYEKGGKGNNALMQRGDVGAVVLIGYEFAFGMQINMSYKFGFLNVLEDADGDAFMRNQAISLGIGFRF